MTLNELMLFTDRTSSPEQEIKRHRQHGDEAPQQKLIMMRTEWKSRGGKSVVELVPGRDVWDMKKPSGSERTPTMAEKKEIRNNFFSTRNEMTGKLFSATPFFVRLQNRHCNLNWSPLLRHSSLSQCVRVLWLVAAIHPTHRLCNAIPFLTPQLTLFVLSPWWWRWRGVAGTGTSVTPPSGSLK